MFWTNEKHLYLALTGELLVYFMSYLEKSDHEILGVHCSTQQFVEVDQYIKFSSLIFNSVSMLSIMN